jgi:hypothetical protein
MENKEIQIQEKPQVPATKEDHERKEIDRMAEGVKTYTKLFKPKADPKALVDDLANKINKLPDGPDRMPAIRKMIADNANELAMGEGVGRQVAISTVVSEDYRPFVIAFARQLIEEYKCDNPSEKAMAEIAAIAYVRVMEYTDLFTSIKKTEMVSSENNGFYNTVSKELDRAHRHFESAISMLKQMKVPAINLKVHSKNTFIADKQQFNNVQENNESK